jgi:bifunctional DNA-binding transcriptional regulator/antitoxin component of YhaV-PrlF toxin-antitoxin module
MPSADPSKFITTCEEDEDGNLILSFPDELLEALGWAEGTDLEFDISFGKLIVREYTGNTPDET